MAIDAGFDNAFSLRLKLKAANRHITELESGGAHAELKARMSSLRHLPPGVHAVQHPLPCRQRAERAAPTWNSKMLDLVREMIHWRNSLDPEAPPGDELVGAAAGFGARFDAVLELAESEYTEIPPAKYYRDGYNLFRRLRDYRDSQLRFLDHLEVDPGNSLCERLARVFKRKQHQAMAFRSFEFLCYVCDAISVMYNMRLAGKDVFAETAAIFDRPLGDIVDVPALSATG